MAKKIIGNVKLQVKGGQANPSPPIGPALGQHGVNIAEFCKAFNARTQDQTGTVIPVVITIYADSEPNKDKVGEVSKKQIEEIAKLKFEDLNAYDMNGAVKIIEGTARSMGINITQ